MKKIFNYLILFTIAFSLYISIEVIWDTTSHYSMGIISGLAFIIGGILSDIFGWKLDLLIQSFIITVVITVFEAIVGNIDYYFWHLNIWDYSDMPMNYFNGKICAPFCFIWLFFSFVIIFVYDAVDYYWLHNGERPEYWIFGKRVWQMPKRKCHID